VRSALAEVFVAAGSGRARAGSGGRATLSSSLPVVPGVEWTQRRSWGPGGRSTTLATVARLEVTAGPQDIRREDRRTSISVLFAAGGRGRHVGVAQAYAT
jgi:hypothetical protein